MLVGEKRICKKKVSKKLCGPNKKCGKVISWPKKIFGIKKKLAKVFLG